ncbi:antitoxin VbhA family protein [Glaciimonas sp. GG7]
MSKDVQMTFRIEPELRAEFTDAASQEHRPAAQVLREFTRTYVNKARERQSASANDAINEVISASERRRRENAANFARASVGLEGFKLSKEVEAQTRRFINGEIELAEFIQVKADAAPASSR